MKKYLLILLLFISNCIFSQSYLGTITKQVNFREGPGSDYEIISSLKPNTKIFISSLEAENDYYNIIDIENDVEGYVHKSFVKIGNSIIKSDGGFIASTGSTSNYDSETTIYNNTSSTMTLKLNSNVYKFLPKETKKITLTPGDYDFRASAPGVLPNIGTKTFTSNQAYQWEFYISTRRR